MLPPFVTNEVDPLLKFNDRSFHEECFRLDPHSGEVEKRLNEIAQRSNPEKRLCTVCGLPIDDPDN
jgi:hypothetical protein